MIHHHQQTLWEFHTLMSNRIGRESRVLRAPADVEVSDASEAAAQALDILNSTDYFALNHYTTLCVPEP